MLVRLIQTHSKMRSFYSRRKYYCYQQNFCYPLKMVNFPILRQQYWTVLYCSPFSYRSSNFAIAKVVALNLFPSIFVCVSQIGSWLLFCIASNIVISLPTIVTAITLEREPSKKRQRTNTKKYAKRIKSDNFTRSNREKSNIAIAMNDWMAT